jgi:hypothetical protein
MPGNLRRRARRRPVEGRCEPQFGLTFLTSVVTTGFAAPDTLLQAVGFALTGSDNTQVQVIDRASCTFAVGNEVYHLNNIDTDRLAITSPTTCLVPTGSADQCVSIYLHGEAPIYERTDTQTKSDPTNEFDRIVKQTHPEVFEPHPPV